MDADKKIHFIEALHINFEVEPEGYPVDKITGKGTPPEKKTELDRMIVSIKIHNEIGERIVTEPYATAIYDAVWKFLNQSQE